MTISSNRQTDLQETTPMDSNVPVDDSKGNVEEIDLQKYWLVLKRRWPVIVVVFMAFFGLGLFAAMKQKPGYQATGKLLFQSSRVPSLTGVGEKIGELDSLEFMGNPLNTQAVVVQSIPIMQETIDALNLKDKKGKPFSPEMLIGGLKVTPVLKTDIMEVSYMAKDAEFAAAVVNQVMKSYIAKNVLTNRAQAISAGEFIAQQLPRAKAEVDRAAEELRQFLAENRIIDLEKEATAAVETISSLDNQASGARAELVDTEKQVVELQAQLGIPVKRAVDIISLSGVGSVRETMSELQRVRRQLAIERTRFTDDHPMVATLANQEANLNALLERQISLTLGPDSGVSFGDLQISDLKQVIATNLVMTRAREAGVEQRVNMLTSIRQGHRKRADLFPNLDKRQRELEQQLKVAQTAYETLLSRLQQIRLAESQNVGNARVIQAAVAPSEPMPSKKKLFMGGGAFVGLMLGLAAAFLVDLIDRSVKTVKEATDLFGYPLVGLIPRFEAGDATDAPRIGVSPRVIVADASRSIIHEAYQMLWANLRFTSSDKKIRTIVVTSSVSKEGKSEVSANLAVTIAQAGRRVLLVDADMRQPSQHHLWDLVNSVGLSNVIAGQAELSNAVQQVASNLSVLPAGYVPPNPPALLDSESMADLISQFSQEYDYIVFDTPPLAGVADAAVLGKMVNGVLLVVRPGVVDAATAGVAKTMLVRSAPNVLGIVANGVDTKQEPDNYFYYRGPMEQPTERSGFGKIAAAKLGVKAGTGRAN